MTAAALGFEALADAYRRMFVDLCGPDAGPPAAEDALASADVRVMTADVGVLRKGDLVLVWPRGRSLTGTRKVFVCWAPGMDMALERADEKQVREAVEDGDA